MYADFTRAANGLYRCFRSADPIPWRRCSVLYLLLLLALTLASGCANRPPNQAAHPETCDPIADASVERGDWEKALAAHERVLAERPADCLAMYHLGYIWGHLGDRAKEIGFYQAAIKCGRTTDDGLYFNLGMAYGDLHDLERAVGAFQKAVAIAPGHADNYFGLGLAQQVAGRPKQAEAAFLKAFSVDPTYVDACLALARLYVDQNRWDQAEAFLQRADRIDPGNEAAQELRRLLKSRRALQYDR